MCPTNTSQRKLTVLILISLRIDYGICYNIRYLISKLSAVYHQLTTLSTVSETIIDADTGSLRDLLPGGEKAGKARPNTSIP
jgi:hypothetical protein